LTIEESVCLADSVSRRGTDEFLDAPAGLVLDEVADGHRGDHDAQVRSSIDSRMWW
jgi:hypothetical protein